MVLSLSAAGTSQLEAQSLTLLHAFALLSGGLGTNLDGANPSASLVLAGHVLYGTAIHGGPSGSGSIFAMNTDGSGFTNLYHFTALSGSPATNGDGAYPAAGLVMSGNTLYGTAGYGGLGGAGSVFRIGTDGSGFTNLHSFSPISGVLFSNIDGAHPQAGLILSGNTLYGTALDGGLAGNGTVFALQVDGAAFTNLHNFSSAFFNPSGYYTNLDGANPLGGLALSNQTLFGSAAYGAKFGQGALFALDTDGSGFSVLHHFSLVSRDPSGNYTNTDGANPTATLVLSGDILYGTARNGGIRGQGTVYAVGTNGSKLTSLHAFNAPIDGAYPVAPLLLSGQSLYGTASSTGPSGAGTLFALGTNVTGFINLFAFDRLSSLTNQYGAHPVAGLVVSGTVLYGATYDGAPSGSGSLFSFSIAPPPSLAINRSAANLVLSWPIQIPAPSLQFATGLNPPIFWTNISISSVVNGQNVFTNLNSDGHRFYRLTR